MSILQRLGIFVFASLCAFALQAKDLSPSQVPGAVTLTTDQAHALFKQGVLFVDVRRDSDWEAGRIAGAEHLELHKVLSEESLSKIVGKGDPVVFYCNGPKCHRSSKASAKAVSWGFKKVYYYRDGFPAWQAANLPTE